MRSWPAHRAWMRTPSSICAPRWQRSNSEYTRVASPPSRAVGRPAPRHTLLKPSRSVSRPTIRLWPQACVSSSICWVRLAFRPFRALRHPRLPIRDELRPLRLLIRRQDVIQLQLEVAVPLDAVGGTLLGRLHCRGIVRIPRIGQCHHVRGATGLPGRELLTRLGQNAVQLLLLRRTQIEFVETAQQALTALRAVPPAVLFMPSAPVMMVVMVMAMVSAPMALSLAAISVPLFVPRVLATLGTGAAGASIRPGLG